MGCKIEDGISRQRRKTRSINLGCEIGRRKQYCNHILDLGHLRELWRSCFRYGGLEFSGNPTNFD
jgi:hypothetical protein